MTVLELENITDATTEHWSSARTESTQSNPTTRRVALDAYAGELETREIERNPEFHATIVRRLSHASPGELVDAGEALSD